MTRHLFPLFLLAVALAVFVSAPLAAQEKADKNTHEGKFVKATSDKAFVMEVKDKEHAHTLALNAKVIGPDGKDCKLADFRKGQRIRVATKADDKKVATKVEALKD